MKFLAKTSLLRPVEVDFPGGRSVKFIQNAIFILSVDEVEYLKKNKKEVYLNLLKLKQKAKPQEQVFDELVIKIEEKVDETKVNEELTKYLTDNPDTDLETLVPVEIIVGEEPKPKKKKSRRKNNEQTD